MTACPMCTIRFNGHIRDVMSNHIPYRNSTGFVGIANSCCPLCDNERTVSIEVAAAFRLGGLRAAKVLNPTITEWITCRSRVCAGDWPNDWCEDCGTKFMRPPIGPHGCGEPRTDLSNTILGLHVILNLEDTWQIARENASTMTLPARGH